MINPFDVILERINGLETLILNNSQTSTKQDPQTEIIDRAELEKRLGLTEPTIIAWERKGKIPSFRIGGSVRYNWPRVIEALEKNGGKRCGQ